MTNDPPTRPADSAPDTLPAYVCPRLIVYGSMWEITRKVNNKSNKDGGSVAGKKKSQ